MPRPIDALIKKNYELIHFKRNFKIKLIEAIRWGLDTEDKELLIDTWKRKASALGSEGNKRWSDVEKDIPAIEKQYKAQKGMAWAQNDPAPWKRGR